MCLDSHARVSYAKLAVVSKKTLRAFPTTNLVESASSDVTGILFMNNTSSTLMR